MMNRYRLPISLSFSLDTPAARPDQLVGITHECDFPHEVRKKPVVVRPAINMSQMSLAEIDRAVSERIASGASLYQVDEALLKKLRPDLIVTQNLCQVCAPSGNEVSQVLKALNPAPEILWMSPKSLEEVFKNIRDLGRATGRLKRAEEIVANGQRRLEQIISRLSKETTSRPRVFCMEWVDPIYNAGHWMGEMVEIAGGTDELSRRGTDSVRIAWDDVVRWAPEILVVMPCGSTTRAPPPDGRTGLRAGRTPRPYPGRRMLRLRTSTSRWARCRG